MDVVDEAKAQLALEILNKRVASIFTREARHVVFLFVPMIERHQKYEQGNIITVKETMGDCRITQGIIRLVVAEGWQGVAVHELVHLYNPGMREKTVRERTKDVIRYLKSPMLWGAQDDPH